MDRAEAVTRLARLRGEPALKTSARMRVEAADLLRVLDALPQALEQARLALALEPGDTEAEKIAALVELELGDAAASQARMCRLAAARPNDASVMAHAARLLELAGDYASRTRALEAAARLAPADERAAFEWADALLRRGDAARAAKASAAARVRGGAAVLRGRYAEADALLSGCGDDAGALVWRAEARLRLGKPREAVADLDRAEALGERGAPAQALRLLCDAALGRELDAARYDLVVSRVPRPLLGLGTSLEGHERSTAVLEKALKVCGGYRAGRETFLKDGALVRHERFFPRDPLLEAQALARFGAAPALARFAALIDAHPKDGYVRASYGELLLWLGRYDDARRELTLALKLDPALPWPNVGLCAAAALSGEPKRAWTHLEKAAALHASPNARACWTVELRRRAGDAKKAREALQASTDLPPFRPALWLNAALLGDEAALAALEKALPSLLKEAAGDPERALALMRGNRSSWLPTFMDARGALRPARLRVDPETAPGALRGSPYLFEEAASAAEAARWPTGAPSDRHARAGRAGAARAAQPKRRR